MKCANVLSVLAAILFNVASWAQEIKPLKIGDQVPDIEMKMANYPKPTIRLSEFKGKALLIDCWATFCAPCVFGFQKMDSLKKKYGNELAILPVTVEDKKAIEIFVKRLQHVKNINVSSVVEDVNIQNLFPHELIPHYIWIGKTGVVKALTGPEEITDKNVQKFINGEQLNLAIKDDFKNLKQEVVSTEKSDFSDFYQLREAVMKDTNIFSFSYVSGYSAKAGGGSAGKLGDQGLCFINISILGLYKIAYGGDDLLKYFGNPGAVKVITNDSTNLFDREAHPGMTAAEALEWRKQPGHVYCCLVKAPPGPNAKEGRYEVLKQLLDNTFPYIKASINKVKTAAFVLKKLSADTTLFASKDTGVYRQERTPYYLVANGVSMTRFFTDLKLNYQGSPFPVFDETNFKGKIDLHIETEISDPDKLNEALKPYGLTFRKEEREVEMLVIRDLRDANQTKK